MSSPIREHNPITWRHPDRELRGFVVELYVGESPTPVSRWRRHPGHWTSRLTGRDVREPVTPLERAA